MPYTYFSDVIEICAESFVHTDIEGCGQGICDLFLTGITEGYISDHIQGNTIRGSILTFYSEGQTIYETQIVSNEPFIYYSLPLLSEGSGYISPDFIDKCYVTPKPNPFKEHLLNEVKNKVEILSRFPPLYITKDLNVLWDNHRPFVPELGEVIPFNQLSSINYKSQDRVLFKILATTKNCGVNQLRTNWIVTMVEYKGQPVMLLLNHMWDSIMSYPHRYVFNKYLYRELITYLLSLFQEEPCSLRFGGTIKKELNCIQAHSTSLLNTPDCFTTEWEKYCVTPSDSIAQSNQLIEVIDRFISMYGTRG